MLGMPISKGAKISNKNGQRVPSPITLLANKLKAPSTATRRTRTTNLGYNERHAKSGISSPLPDIETFPNQYKGYEIMIEIPEYTAICPKTNLPDFGTITLH